MPVAIVYFALGFLLGAFALSYPMNKERPALPPAASRTEQRSSAPPWCRPFLGYALDVYWTGETIAGARVYTELGYQVSFAIAAGTSLLALCCPTWLYVRDPLA